MIIDYKYKMYNSKHNSKLYDLSQIARWVYNHCIALQKRYYKLYGKYISKYRMQKHISKLRKNNTEWKKLGAQTVQMLTHRVDDAYQRFFKGKSERPPKFKKYNNNPSFCFTQAGYKLEGNKFTINSIGKTFGFFKSRDYEDYDIKRIRIKQDSVGDWYIILTLNVPIQTKKTGNAALGMDFGLKTYLTLSNGDEIQSPLFFKQREANIKELNRSLSKKKKGSNNRNKARVELAREYRKLERQRRDFHFKLAHELCGKYCFIAIEDLNIKAMQQRWGKKVSDLSFSSFVVILKYVAKKSDTVIHKVDRYYASSKTCTCGVKNEELSLKDKEWTCKGCGQTHDRDLLAAKNILSEGIRSYSSACKTAISAA